MAGRYGRGVYIRNFSVHSPHSTTTLSKEMETFATKVYWLADQQKVKENHPKILKTDMVKTLPL